MADDVGDLVAVLKQQRDDTWERCVKASGRARGWYRWSVALAVLAAAGSGAAGATVAAGSLSSTGRAVVAILAFAGAVLSGISAAVGAPGQAKTEQVKSDQLASLVRWADVELVTLPALDRKDAQIRIRDFLVWRDDIQGVSAPQAVRSPTPVEPNPDPVPVAGLPGAAPAPTKPVSQTKAAASGGGATANTGTPVEGPDADQPTAAKEKAKSRPTRKAVATGADDPATSTSATAQSVADGTPVGLSN